MKKDFFDLIIERMGKDESIYFISVGLGWPRTDELAEKFPDRYIQTEASEQTALDISVGLAYSGKVPVIYTITPFYYRAWETIRTYVNREKLHVVMIGAGRDDDYSKHDGYSHDAQDIQAHFNIMKNITQYYPDTKEEMEKAVNLALVDPFPAFVSIRR